MTFTLAMETAKGYLEQRDLDKALKAYAKAWSSTADADEQAQVQQMRGITLRLAKRLDEAENSLLQAYELATSTNDRARIKRDLGMVYLDQAVERGNDTLRMDRASRLFRESFQILFDNREMIEAGASLGFYGRVIFLQGNRREAIRVLHNAHEALHGVNDTYELNNLIWLARASFSKRFHYADRALDLSKATNQPARWKEYLVILVGGDFLYRFLKKRVRA